jgi:hypothetical protein
MPYQNDPLHTFDYPDYLDVAAAQASFHSLAVAYSRSLDLTGSGETQRLSVELVSPSLFTLTGRAASIGRMFNTQEDIPHSPLLAVISERFWRNHFNGDPSVIGKKLTDAKRSGRILMVGLLERSIAHMNMCTKSPPPTG